MVPVSVNRSRSVEFILLLDKSVDLQADKHLMVFIAKGSSSFSCTVTCFHPSFYFRDVATRFNPLRRYTTFLSYLLSVADPWNSHTAWLLSEHLSMFSSEHCGRVLKTIKLVQVKAPGKNQMWSDFLPRQWIRLESIHPKSHCLSFTTGSSFWWFSVHYYFFNDYKTKTE